MEKAWAVSRILRWRPQGVFDINQFMQRHHDKMATLLRVQVAVLAVLLLGPERMLAGASEEGGVPQKDEPREFSVATFNINWGNPNLPNIAKVIRQSKADLVFLQETNTQSVPGTGSSARRSSRCESITSSTPRMCGRLKAASWKPMLRTTTSWLAGCAGHAKDRTAKTTQPSNPPELPRYGGWLVWGIRIG
jgi:hypothetical protein